MGAPPVTLPSVEAPLGVRSGVSPLAVAAAPSTRRASTGVTPLTVLSATGTEILSAPSAGIVGTSPCPLPVAAGPEVATMTLGAMAARDAVAVGTARANRGLAAARVTAACLDAVTRGGVIPSTGLSDKGHARAGGQEDHESRPRGMHLQLSPGDPDGPPGLGGAGSRPS